MLYYAVPHHVMLVPSMHVVHLAEGAKVKLCKHLAEAHHTI